MVRLQARKLNDFKRWLKLASYSLTCEVSGASGPISPSAYQWRKDGTNISTGSILSFTSLSLSDAGQYICQVTVDGMMLSSPPQDIRLIS